MESSPPQEQYGLVRNTFGGICMSKIITKPHTSLTGKIQHDPVTDTATFTGDGMAYTRVTTESGMVYYDIISTDMVSPGDLEELEKLEFQLGHPMPEMVIDWGIIGRAHPWFPGSSKSCYARICEAAYDSH